MAVEIPVYINIAEGINQAVRELPKEITKLENAVGRNALKLNFEISPGTTKSLQEMLTSKLLDKGQLTHALNDVRKQFEAAMLKNASKSRVPAEVTNLIRAYTALEQRITGVRNANTAAMMTIENEIVRTNSKIQSLQKKRMGSSSVADIQNFDYQIKLQQDRIRQLNVQLETYKINWKRASNSATAGVSTTNSALSAQTGLLSRAIGLLSSYASIHMVFRMAKQIRDVTAELEYQRVALGRLIQDEEYGAVLFERIKAAAKESPFRIKQLVTYTKQLAAYRIEQENLFDVTSRLADISAGLGVDMNRLILAYGQVRAASVLRGQELRQFTEAGIPLVELLAEKMGELHHTTYATADVFKLISERAVPFKAVAEIFEEMTDAGGMFYNMQIEQAKTLQGRWEKLKDTYDIALQSIGDSSSFRRYNDVILWSLNKLAEHINVLPKLLEGATAAYLIFRTALRVGNIINAQHVASTSAINAQLVLRRVLTGKLALADAAKIVQDRLLIKAEAKLAAATNGVSRAFARLWLAMVSNPIGALIALIGGLTVAFLSFRKHADAVNDSVVNLDESIDRLNSRMKDVSKTEKLVESYEALAKKTDLSAKESDRLEKYIRRLQRVFPELSLSVEDDTAKIDENTSAMRKNLEDRAKWAKANAESDLALAESDLATNRGRLEPAQKEYRKWARILKSYDEEIERGDRSESFREDSWYKNALSHTKKAQEELDAIEAQISKDEKDIVRLKAILYPDATTTAAWKDLLGTMQTTGAGLQLFSNEQFDGWHRLYDVSTDLEKEWKKMKEDLSGLQNAMPDKNNDRFADWVKDVEIAEERIKGLEAIRDLFGFVWGKQPKQEYQKDPFIDKIENRIKYMQDYQHGLERLSQFMKSSDALTENEKIMSARGDFLGISEDARKAGGQDLSKWYDEQIKEVIKVMKSKGVKGETAEDILRQQFLGKSNWSKMVRDFQALLQKLWDAKTDFDTSNMEKQLKKKMEDIKNKLARSAEATNFFRDIFNKTGNEDIATSITASIYGKGFDKSMKDSIMSTLLGAYKAAEVEANKMLEGENGDLNKNYLEKAVTTSSALKKAIENFDFNYILKNIHLFPQEWHDALENARRDYENFNKEWLKRAVDSYAKYSSIPDRITMTNNQRDELIKLITASNLPAEVKAKLTDAANKDASREVANLRLEGIKMSDDWQHAFERLDRVSLSTLDSLIDKLKEWIRVNQDASPEDVKAVTQALERARAQKIEINGYVGLWDAMKRYDEATADLITLDKNAADYSKKHTDALNAQRDALVDARLSVDAINKSFDEMSSIVSSVADILGLEEDSSAKAHFEGIAEAFKMIGSALAIINGVLALMAVNPVVLGITGVVAGLTAIFTVASSTKVAAANRNIKEQQELLDSLSEAYGHLQDAAEKAFNSDYIRNYQSRLANLQAQEAAYLAQAAAEREKGKKADEDQAKQYEKSAREAANSIAEMREDLQQHFLGTDLTSAARDFASAWIDAYKEFGSTTDAIKEKFRDMITGMVTESLAAQIVQRQLKPIFDYIDGLSGDGVLSVSDAAEVANMTKQAVGSIDLGLTNLMNALSGAGINLRTMGTGLTGISKDIQNASEESILGLAAGVNTQNFYMSQINANVIRIVEMMGGEPRSGQAPGQSDTGAGPTYQDQMLQYARNLPQMASDMAQIRNLLDKVIVKGSNYSVRVR